uniref:Uncharacterized protein n=1 Tax=Medicago truncatula TaxID=3880 RepID=A2Q2T3_MEDTR|nr:hypothetical protein MtrDRAFT_AC152184g31v2 [Medicago truncatula]
MGGEANKLHDAAYIRNTLTPKNTSKAKTGLEADIYLREMTANISLPQDLHPKTAPTYKKTQQERKK